MNLRWLFNGLMLAGAVLGWFIVGGLGQIQDTIRHTGPGVVHYEHHWEEVSESRFKRHNYVQSGFALSLGVVFWIFVALAAKEKRDERETHLANLEAKAEALQTYHYHFASVLDEQTRKRAEDECLSAGLKWRYFCFDLRPSSDRDSRES